MIACFLIKIIGGNWFELICGNQNFINICEWLDNNLITRSIIYAVLYFLSGSLIILAQLKQKIKDNNSLIIIAIILITAIIRQLYSNRSIDGIMDLIVLILLPLIFNIIKDKKVKINKLLRIFIGVIIVFCFQLISQITRNIGINYVDENCIIGFILSIDYYIMIILYFLYSNRKESELNG